MSAVFCWHKNVRNRQIPHIKIIRNISNLVVSNLILSKRRLVGFLVTGEKGS